MGKEFVSPKFLLCGIRCAPTSFLAAVEDLGSFGGTTEEEDSAKWVSRAVGEDYNTNVSAARQGHAAKSPGRNKDSTAKTKLQWTGACHQIHHEGHR